MKATIKFLAGIMFVLISATTSAQFTKLTTFTGPNGFKPNGSLISDGTFLYGMTSEGGTNNQGVIFKVQKDGSGFVKLLDFASATSGAGPNGSLFSDGTFLYGMTALGGANNMGTIFKIRPDGTGFAKIFDFAGTTNGRSPQGSLISDGTFLYGMTQLGGTGNLGTIFKIQKDGSGYVKMFDFTGTANGAEPYGDLLLVGTTLYGLTFSGGSAANKGIIFRIQTDGTGFSRMLIFPGYPAWGEKPMGSLITDGTYLYGMTSAGGASNDGTIFRLQPNGIGLATIKSFRLEQGDLPFGSLTLIGQELYGMTYRGGEGGTNSYGTLFRVKNDGTDHVKLFDFTTINNGWLPNGSLLADGTSVYGLTQQGGGATAGGTLFRFDPPSPPTITSFAATSGAPGTTVTITGTNFNSIPANNQVNFNRWPAAVTASTATSITVTVPAAATTGPISVTVLGKTATSANNFTVLPGSVAIHAYDWAKPVIGTLDVFLNAMTTDGSGNVYTTGSFSETADFDPGAGEFKLTTAGNFDVFVQKLNPKGELQWAFRLGGINQDNAQAITSDAAGNIYVTGRFNGTTTDFDPGPGTTTLPGPSATFICKYDGDMNLIWARQMDNNLSGAIDLAINASNELYLGGGFTGTTDFDPGTGVFSMTSAGSSDIFVLKLTSDGDFIWARKMGGTGSDIVNGLDIDLAGNVLTTGSFAGTADFDPEAGTSNLTVGGTGTDGFISKLNSSGSYVWARKVGGSNSVDGGQAVTVDLDNNILITGNFEGNGDFDPGAGVETLVSQGGQADIFVLKLDAAGNYLWSRSMGSSAYDFGYRIKTDAARNVYHAGNFSANTDFDPGPGTFYRNTPSTSVLSRHAYVSKLDPSGNFIWAWTTSGTQGSYAEVPILSLDNNEDIVLAGYFEIGTVYFDEKGCAPGLTAGISVSSFVTKLSTTATNSCVPNIVFTVQPKSASSCTGSATFNVTASGDTNLVYQWQINTGNFVSLSNDATYSGATTSTLTIQDPGATLNGAVYRVLVHGDNTTDVASSLATLTIGTTPSAPVVSDPAPVCSSADLTLTATGSTDGNYRWYEGSTQIQGQVNGTYVSTATTTKTYGVTIRSGGCESAVSTIVVTVNDCETNGLVVYNAVSPNGDGRNDVFFIENIDSEGTMENKVVIYNRWGDVVFKAVNYDNITSVFTGKTDSGKELPSGTYYYRIEIPGMENLTGYISLRR